MGDSHNDGHNQSNGEHGQSGQQRWTGTGYKPHIPYTASVEKKKPGEWTGIDYEPNPDGSRSR